MLVLSRRSSEQIIIGEGVVVTVLGIQGNKVRLGISAPDDVKILRAELELELPQPQPVEEPVAT